MLVILCMFKRSLSTATKSELAAIAGFPTAFLRFSSSAHTCAFHLYVDKDELIVLVFKQQQGSGCRCDFGGLAQIQRDDIGTWLRG